MCDAIPVLDNVAEKTNTATCWAFSRVDRTMIGRRVHGIFSARTMPNGSVAYHFTPNDGRGSVRSILAPGVGHVHSDMVSTFGVQPHEAARAVAKLERNGMVDVAASVYREILPRLINLKG